MGPGTYGSQKGRPKKKPTGQLKVNMKKIAATINKIKTTKNNIIKKKRLTTKKQHMTIFTPERKIAKKIGIEVRNYRTYSRETLPGR